MRIVHLANFVTPTSGGIRTYVAALGRAYAEAGHELVLVVPDPGRDVGLTGEVRTVGGVPLPCSGGYRAIIARDRVAALLDELAPDRIEVSDRMSLTWVGSWARERGIPSVAIVHEHLGELAGRHAGWLPTRGAVRRANRHLCASFTTLVCASRYVASDLEGLTDPALVPLGVDLTTFSRGARSSRTREELLGSDDVLLVLASRLSREKCPEVAIATLEALRRRGVRARLVVLGDGPQRGRLERRARGLPVRFAGHVRERAAVAEVLASADVALAPGPHETFGLAALEALACGTPVVTTRAGAVQELLVGHCGVAGYGHALGQATAVQQVLRIPEPVRRAAARARAEEYPWSRTVAAMLAVHGAPPRVALAV